MGKETIEGQLTKGSETCSDLYRTQKGQAEMP